MERLALLTELWWEAVKIAIAETLFIIRINMKGFVVKHVGEEGGGDIRWIIVCIRFASTKRRTSSSTWSRNCQNFATCTILYLHLFYKY